MTPRPLSLSLSISCRHIPVLASLHSYDSACKIQKTHVRNLLGFSSTPRFTSGCLFQHIFAPRAGLGPGALPEKIGVARAAKHSASHRAPRPASRFYVYIYMYIYISIDLFIFSLFRVKQKQLCILVSSYFVLVSCRSHSRVALKSLSCLCLPDFGLWFSSDGKTANTKFKCQNASN